MPSDADKPLTCAVVLARAGSKGVPGKNVAPVAGRPCIVWTLDAVRAARTLDRACVSTDDPRAAAAAAAADISVIARPAALASDGATVDDAARHALASLDAAHPRPARDDDVIVILYANVPVRPPGLIDRAVDLLRSAGADSVQSYAPVGKHHPLWTCRVGGDGAVRPWEGEQLFGGIYRRQDLPPAHVPDGGVLAVTRRALTRAIPGVAPGPHAFLGRDRRGVINPEGSVVDIDSRIDLLVADAILRAHAEDAVPGLPGAGSGSVT